MHICAPPPITKSGGIREIFLQSGLCPCQNMNFHTPTGIPNDLLLYTCMRWLLPVFGCRYPFPILSSNTVHKTEQENKQTKRLQRLLQSDDTKWGGKYGPASVPGKKNPNSISSTIATPWQSWRRTHRDQDLEGAVHDLDVPILQGTADHRDVGMAIQPFDARHWSLLPYTARTIFTPPWLVPGDVERQEFTVLKRKVSKRSPFAVRTSDVLSDGGHIKSMENLKFLRSPPSRNASTDQNTFALYSWLKSNSQAGFCGRNHFWGSPTALQQSYFTIQ